MIDSVSQTVSSRKQEPMLPISKGERVVELDVLRGFAIFGILLMNIEYFTTPLQDLFIEVSRYEGIHNTVDVLTGIFVTGKFITMFSLLFGMGFAVMQIRSEKAGQKFSSIYAKRNGWLFAIGLVHTLLIWSGDILVSYAFTGFLLLLFFRNTKTSRLWKYALAFFSILLLITVIGGFASEGTEATDPDDPFQAWMTEQYTQANETYATGSFLEVTKRRMIDTLSFMAILPFMSFYLLAIFLFGAWLIKVGIMQQPKEHLPLFRKVFWIGLPIGLFMSVHSVTGFTGMETVLTDEHTGWQAITTTIAPPLLCLVYASGMILLVNKFGHSVAKFFAPVGRMALTNYILQSLVFTLIFYGYGLGYWGELSRAMIFVMAVIFYLLQIVFSKWWMSRYNYGPLEWVWRRLTYGKLN